jgi:hypothetical protein
MPVDNIYGVYAVSIDGVTVPITSFQPSPGVSVQSIGANGTLTPSFAYVAGRTPSFRFTTRALKTILDKIATPWRALRISTVTPTTSPIIFYLRKHLTTGERSSAVGDFQSFTISNGLLIPRGITAQHPNPAEMQFEFFALSLDDTNPVVVNAADSSPSLSLGEGDTLGGAAGTGLWTAGPVKINQVSVQADEFTGVQSINIDPGVQVDSRGGDGNVFPSFISLTNANPTISLQLSDGLALADLGFDGAAQGSNNSTVFLRAITQNGARVADATTAHISFAIDDGIITAQGMQGTHPGAVTSNLLITPTDDQTNVIIAVDTAKAIS